MTNETLSDDLRALGWFLLEQPEGAADRAWSGDLQAEPGRSILWAIRVLVSKDLDVNAITVFEYLKGAVPLELLTEMTLQAMGELEVAVFFDTLPMLDEDDSGDWNELG